MPVDSIYIEGALFVDSFTSTFPGAINFLIFKQVASHVWQNAWLVQKD